MDQRGKDIQLTGENLAFIESIAQFYEAYGIPRIGGRMFGLFLITVDPLPAEKIAALLSASRGSVSTNIRGLIANGWVERVTFPGDRTEYYRFSPLAWERVLEFRMRGMAPLRQIASRGLSGLPEGHPARAQLEEMIRWVDLQIQSHKAMIETWQNMRAQL